MSPTQRQTLLRSLVLSAISDDYEDLPMIISEVTPWAAGHSLQVTPAQIIATLMELLQLGHAKAYRFIAPYDQPPEVALLTHLTEDDGCYFLITPEGLRAGQSSDLP
jgi:hypothetical protein